MNIDVLKMFMDSGALLEGHFVLSSGKHSPNYIEKFRIFENPRHVEAIGKNIADNIRGKTCRDITVVVGLATGGILIAHEVAKNLGAKAVFSEKIDGKMQFKRGFNFNSLDPVCHFKDILIVDDIVTTGKNIEETYDAIHNIDKTATIHGAYCVIDRSKHPIDIGMEFYSLLKLDLDVYDADKVPEWLAKIPEVIT